MPRLFIAVPLDASVRANLDRVGTAAQARGAVWVKPENLHLTLAFLGEVEERRVADARTPPTRPPRGTRSRSDSWFKG